MRPSPERTDLSPVGLADTVFPAMQRDPLLESTASTLDLQGDTTDSSSRLELEDELPVQIGRFLVRSRLGAGGMGVVYAAHDPTLDRAVAIKLIRATRGGLHDSEDTGRLLREAQALAKLSHPNVVSVYEVGRLDDQIYLVMELVRGHDLGRWLGKEPRSWDQILDVYCEAGRGLAAAHAAGLVHRDFKPSNAILGADGRVRVLDFGLARASVQGDEGGPPPDLELGDSASMSLDLRLTRTGTVLGTPAYMAPEQFLGQETGVFTDQFSFCVALYGALFGQPPFPGNTFLALCTAVCAGQVRTPTPGPVPDHVVRAVLRGLSVDPAARWPSIDLLLAELTHRPAAADGAAAVFGHRGPQGRLRQRLAELRRGRGGVALLEGEPGLGKSHLARALADEATAAGVRVLRGGAEGPNFVAAYHAWRPVIEALLDVADTHDPAARRARVDAAFATHDLRRALAPLLADVIPLDLADNDFTRQLDPQVRADNLLSLLTDLLRRRLAGAPALIVVEDAHWFDSASWSLALALSRLTGEAAALLVLTARPDDSPPPARRELLTHADAEVLRLTALSPEDCGALLGARLGLADVPASLARRVHDWTSGTPFFVEQVALALQEAGLVRRDAGAAVLIAGEQELAAFQVPASVEALISRRLARLSPGALLALQVIAALGRPVARDELSGLLARIDPGLDARGADAALAAGLLVHPPRAPTVLAFPHALALKATYEAIDPPIRRRLHEIVATWYEEHVPGDMASRVAALAHHWSRAEVPDKALRYLGPAGEQAFLAFASREAVGFLREALARADQAAAPPSPAARAGWHRMLGESHVKLGEYHAARRHLNLALRHLGYASPASAPALVLGVLVHLVRQLLHRGLPTGLVQRRGEPARTARDAARLYQALSELAFFEQDALALTHGALAALNVAERSGDARELAVNYSTAAILFGVLSLHGVARGYVARARAAADRDGTSATIAYTTLLRTVYGQSVPEREWLARDIPDAIERFAALGDRPRVHITLANDAFFHLVIEDFTAADRTADALAGQLDLASAQIQTFALVQRLALDLVRGEPDLAALDRLEALVQRNRLAHGDALLGEGVSAAARLRRGEIGHALALAERVSARLAQQLPTTLYTSFGIRGALDVFLAVDPHSARKAIARCRKALRQIAFHNPAVRPSAALAEAQIAAALEDPAVALRRARRAAELAAASRLRHSEGLARLEQARLLAPADPARAEQLAAAERLLSAAGSTAALAHLRRVSA
jgi:hypothetical protein